MHGVGVMHRRRIVRGRRRSSRRRRTPVTMSETPFSETPGSVPRHDGCCSECGPAAAAPGPTPPPTRRGWPNRATPAGQHDRPREQADGAAQGRAAARYHTACSTERHAARSPPHVSTPPFSETQKPSRAPPTTLRLGHWHPPTTRLKATGSFLSTALVYKPYRDDGGAPPICEGCSQRLTTGRCRPPRACSRRHHSSPLVWASACGEAALNGVVGVLSTRPRSPWSWSRMRAACCLSATAPNPLTVRRSMAAASRTAFAMLGSTRIRSATVRRSFVAAGVTGFTMNTSCSLSTPVVTAGRPLVTIHRCRFRHDFCLHARL